MFLYAAVPLVSYWHIAAVRDVRAMSAIAGRPEAMCSF
jgi:hypothetical protein